MVSCSHPRNLAGPQTYQLVKDTFVQLPLRRPALPHLVIVVVEALPVRTELLQAVRVDILDAKGLVNGSTANDGHWIAPVDHVEQPHTRSGHIG